MTVQAKRLIGVSVLSFVLGLAAFALSGLGVLGLVDDIFPSRGQPCSSDQNHKQQTDCDISIAKVPTEPSRLCTLDLPVVFLEYQKKIRIRWKRSDGGALTVVFGKRNSPGSFQGSPAYYGSSVLGSKGKAESSGEVDHEGDYEYSVQLFSPKGKYQCTIDPHVIVMK